jgi:site-specific DNA-methyltransferase (adenine-specific)|tara:strand:+ start:45 stop:794 length:750 start_codon:yes stop_codon:yes gene_type:complete
MVELYKGDCLEVMKTIESGSIDAIITDPPYGTTACKWDSVIDFKLMWEQLNRIIKPNGAIVLFGSEPFSSALRMSNIKNYKYDWVWYKNAVSGFANAKRQPMRNHELISVFYNKQCKYYPIKETRDLSKKSIERHKYNFNTTTEIKSNVYGEMKRIKNKPNDLCYPKTIKKFNCIVNNSKQRVHPTQKPILLMEYLIKTYTNENETVLDFTMGSGSTGVACVNTKRNFIGIEMDAKYFDIATKRINLNK